MPSVWLPNLLSTTAAILVITGDYNISTIAVVMCVIAVFVASLFLSAKWNIPLKKTVTELTIPENIEADEEVLTDVLRSALVGDTTSSVEIMVDFARGDVDSFPAAQALCLVGKNHQMIESMSPKDQRQSHYDKLEKLKIKNESLTTTVQAYKEITGGNQ